MSTINQKVDKKTSLTNFKALIQTTLLKQPQAIFNFDNLTSFSKSQRAALIILVFTPKYFVKSSYGETKQLISAKEMIKQLKIKLANQKNVSFNQIDLNDSLKYHSIYQMLLKYPNRIFNYPAITNKSDQALTNQDLFKIIVDKWRYFAKNNYLNNYDVMNLINIILNSNFKTPLNVKTYQILGNCLLETEFSDAFYNHGTFNSYDDLIDHLQNKIHYLATSDDYYDDDLDESLMQFDNYNDDTLEQLFIAIKQYRNFVNNYSHKAIYRQNQSIITIGDTINWLNEQLKNVHSS